MEGSLHRLLQNDGIIHECNIGLFDRLWAVNNESFGITKQCSHIRYVCSIHYRTVHWFTTEWNSLDEQTSLNKTESKRIHYFSWEVRESTVDSKGVNRIPLRRIDSILTCSDKTDPLSRFKNYYMFKESLKSYNWGFWFILNLLESFDSDYQQSPDLFCDCYIIISAGGDEWASVWALSNSSNHSLDRFLQKHSASETAYSLE